MDDNLISIFDLLEENSNLAQKTHQFEENKESISNIRVSNIRDTYINEDDFFRSSSMDYFRQSCDIERTSSLISNRYTYFKNIKFTSKFNFHSKDFDFLTSLGNGAYAEVFKAKHKITGEIYSIKVIDIKTIEKEGKNYQIFIENEMLNFCNHKNIIQTFGCYEDKENFCIVEEYCSKGDLSDFLNNNLNKLTLEEIQYIISQIVMCLEYLSNLHIIHRDIKPENFIINKNFDIKLIDFGTATFKGKIFDEINYQFIDEETYLKKNQFSESFSVFTKKLSNNENDDDYDGENNLKISNKNRKSSESSIKEMKKNNNMEDMFENNYKKSKNFEIVKRQKFVGTAEYMPPEIINNNQVGEYSDIWSLICIIFQIFTGNSPFRDKTEYLIFQNILDLKYNNKNIEKIPANAKDLIFSIMKLNPKERFGYDKVLGYNFNLLKSHSFFKVSKQFNIEKIKNSLLKKTLKVNNNNNNNDDKLIFELNVNSNSNNSFNCNKINKSNNELNEIKFSKMPSNKDLSYMTEPIYSSNRSENKSLNGKIIRKGTLKKKSPYFYYDLRKLVLYDTPRLDYIDPETKKIKGTIMLNINCNAKLVSSNQFSLNTPNRVYYFMCKEKYDISPWVNDINEAIKKYCSENNNNNDNNNNDDNNNNNNVIDIIKEENNNV